MTCSATPEAVCVGDCSRDDAVTIAELLRMVNIALGDASVDSCAAGDPNHDQMVAINEILQAVGNALARLRLTWETADRGLRG